MVEINGQKLKQLGPITLTIKSTQYEIEEFVLRPRLN